MSKKSKQPSNWDSILGENDDDNPMSAFDEATLEKLQVQVELGKLKLAESLGELIPKVKVQKVFTEIFSELQNHFIPLPANLAPKVTAICGIEDPERTLKVKIMIAEAVEKAIESMKLLVAKNTRI